MSEQDSLQVRRSQLSSLVVASLVCMALPSIVLLVSQSIDDAGDRRRPVIELIVGSIVGAVLPFLYWAPYRSLGLVAFASIAWCITTAFGLASGHWVGWGNGLALGLMIGAITRARRGPEMVEETYWLAAGILLGTGTAWANIVNGPPFSFAAIFVFSISLLLLIWAFSRLFRPLFEMCLEPIVWLMYDIRGRGQGLVQFPLVPSCIVIANHACWLDPLFMAKVLPRPITPMMTSRFYNLPILRWLMVAFGVISVSEKAIKKDVPEINEAIAALDRGECLLVFPEGYLRRSEEQPLRRFGQGIWQILLARPQTPVFSCWIEGAWGSYTSYCHGKPTQNKKLDFRRPIQVAVAQGETVPQDVLSDHLRTRFHLMNLVGQARGELGLPHLPPFELHTSGVEKLDHSAEAAE